MKVVKIASWDTLEGVAQAHMVMQAIREYDSEIVPELMAVGAAPAGPVGGRGTQPSPLDQALLERRADLYVVGLHELGGELPPGLPIVAVGRRGDARNVLAVPFRRGLPNAGCPIGVSSLGDRAQIAGIYPGWRADLVGGSVMERLERLDKEEFGAMVLPAAGLAQIRKLDRAYEFYSIDQMLPPAGQGIIAVRGRAGESMSMLAAFHDVDSWDMALAERAFMEVANGAETPAAVHAVIRDDKIVIHGMLADEKGKLWLGVLSGGREDAGQIGAALAARLRLDAAGPRPVRRYND